MNIKLFIEKLSQQIPVKNILTDPKECLAYSIDYSRNQGCADAVVFVTDKQQVQAVASLCNELKIPLTARGGGTGTPGGAVPVAGGVVLSFERMNRIVKLDPDNRVMVVEPGVSNQAIQDEAAKHGFFWAPDPGSAANCTVAGNLAYNAAGPRAVKYGTTRENTLGLEAVLANGEIFRTGSYTTKSAIGYDLTRLLIGSEGTLAIITEAVLKLIPLPEAKKTLRATYFDEDSAANAVVKIMSQPVVPAALEFLDKKAIELVRQQGIEIVKNAGGMLIIEIDGSAKILENDAKMIQLAASNLGLLSFEIANNAAEDQNLWKARKALSPALKSVAPTKINEDIVIPVAALPQLLQRLKSLSQKYQILIVNFGHAGNGNIHVNLMFDSADAKQLKNALACLEEVFASVIALRGTISGEHGIGLEKKAFLPQVVDPVALQMMREIKNLFDPNNILNPGKIFV